MKLSWLRKSIALFLVCSTFQLTQIAAGAELGGSKVKYAGGTFPALKTGEEMRLLVSSDKIAVSDKVDSLFSIPPSAVTDLSFGQEVHRRIGTAAGLAVVSLGIGALVAFSKSKKDYIGITWDDAGHKGGLVFQADKNEYRGIITALEGVTGKKAVNTDPQRSSPGLNQQDL